MATTATYEKADDYTLRKIELVERVEEKKYDDLKAHLEYLQTRKQECIEWYDKQIEDTMLDIAEADKLSCVSAKAEAIEAVGAVTEEIINP